MSRGGVPTGNYLTETGDRVVVRGGDKSWATAGGLDVYLKGDEYKLKTHDVWRTDLESQGYKHYFSSKEELRQALVKNFKPEIKTYYHGMYLLAVPVMILAILIAFGLWMFTLAPVATVSVLGVAGLTMCTRFLSGKLAANIKQTAKNTEDIKEMKGGKDE